MRRTTWLAGVSLVLALGPGATSAMARSEAAVGATSVRVEAIEDVGADPTNNITIQQGAAGLAITDTSGITSGNVGAGCRVVDANNVLCPIGSNVTRIDIELKNGNDVLNINANVALATVISGGAGNDELNGGSGADRITGLAGQDILRGNAGDDTINTQGAPGQAEADTVNCGAGNDTAVTDARDGFENPTATPPGGCEQINPSTEPGVPTPPTTPTTPTPGAGPSPSPFQPAINPIQQGQPTPRNVPAAPRGFACTAEIFLGTTAADRFLGTPGGDRMVGLGGNDLMDGLAGQDCMYGGDGNDTMRAGDGNDRLSAGNGNDPRVDGGAGADSVYGGGGNDYVLGGNGNDVLSAGAGNDRISGGAGRDRISASSGRDRVTAGDGNDVIDTRDGSRDIVNCGAGRDTVRRDSRDRLISCERRVSRLPRS